MMNFVTTNTTLRNLYISVMTAYEIAMQVRNRGILSFPTVTGCVEKHSTIGTCMC